MCDQVAFIFVPTMLLLVLELQPSFMIFQPLAHFSPISHITLVNLSLLVLASNFSFKSLCKMINIEGQRFIITWFQRILKEKRMQIVERELVEMKENNKCAKSSIVQNEKHPICWPTKQQLLSEQEIKKEAMENNRPSKSYILKQQCLSVCVGSAWKIQSLPVPCGVCLSMVTNMAGRPGQPLRGAGRGAISIKEILGENRGTCI